MLLHIVAFTCILRSENFLAQYPDIQHRANKSLIHFHICECLDIFCFDLQSGFTPLHIAAHYGKVSVAKLLIEIGADVNYKAKVIFVFKTNQTVTVTYTYCVQGMSW